MLHAAGKSELDAPVEASTVRGGGAGIRPPLEAGEGPSEIAAAPFPVVALLSNRHRFATVSDSVSGLLAAFRAGKESCTHVLVKMIQCRHKVRIGVYGQHVRCIVVAAGFMALINTSLECVMR